MHTQYKQFAPGRYFVSGGQRKYFKLVDYFSPFEKSSERRAEALRQELKAAGKLVRVLKDPYGYKAVYMGENQ